MFRRLLAGTGDANTLIYNDIFETLNP